MKGAFNSTQKSGNFGWFIKWKGPFRFGPTGHSGPGALSIQQKLRFEISETSRAQWNGTFRLHRPDKSHRAFCYCGFAAHS